MNRLTCCNYIYQSINKAQCRNKTFFQHRYLLQKLQNLISSKKEWKNTDTFKRLRFIGDLVSVITEEKDVKFDAVIFLKSQTNK